MQIEISTGYHFHLGQKRRLIIMLLWRAAETGPLIFLSECALEQPLWGKLAIAANF